MGYRVVFLTMVFAWISTGPLQAQDEVNLEENFALLREQWKPFDGQLLQILPTEEGGESLQWRLTILPAEIFFIRVNQESETEQTFLSSEMREEFQEIFTEFEPKLSLSKGEEGAEDWVRVAYSPAGVRRLREEMNRRIAASRRKIQDQHDQRFFP